MDGNGQNSWGGKSNICAGRQEKVEANERVSGEKEKLLYIIVGERTGEWVPASGQCLANDAYCGNPGEDSLGYSND